MVVSDDGSSRPSGAVVSVPLAIALGLLASFVQSLGLTIQRKSHILAARQPLESRPAEWRQPLWVVGFIIFIVANIGGTIFQIGALPIVMLAPLGAVSLLYNALLAKFLLEDALGSTMIGGTALILVGAVLIGYFGAIQEPPHSLDELLSLFGRSPFIALATFLFMSFACVMVVAHLAEWQLLVYLNAPPVSPTLRSSKSHRGKKYYARLTRRWSAPTLAPLDEVSETTSGVATPVLAVRDQERLQQDQNESLNQNGSKTQISNGGTSQPGKTIRKIYGSTWSEPSSRQSRRASSNRKRIIIPEIIKEETEAVKKTKVLLAVGFAAISGTLSGLCLLLAKSGVELLVLTFGLGKNQFNRLGSWALVGVMLFAALAQLWYLNKSLRMADPTLVCPLAFCFYNTSSIALGLVYFDQISAISSLSLLLIVIGIVILLAGVVIVSRKAPPQDADGDDADTLDRLLSPVNDDVFSPSSSNPTETEALLANAGGIAGPHLPPPTLVTPPLGEQQSPSAMLTESPPTLGSPLGSPTSSRHRRSSSGGKPRSSSSSHHHTLGLGLQPAFHYVDGGVPDCHAGPCSSSHTPSSAQRTLTNSPRSPPSQSGAATVGSPRRRSSGHLYSSIITRGLSIGISPSSPGFHIGPFSPEDDEEGDEQEDIERRRRDLEAQGGSGGRGKAPFMDRRTASENDVTGRKRSVSPLARLSAGVERDSIPTTSRDDSSALDTTSSPAGDFGSDESRGSAFTIVPPASQISAPPSASSSAFRLFLPAALDSRTLNDRLARIRRGGSSPDSNISNSGSGGGSGGSGTNGLGLRTSSTTTSTRGGRGRVGREGGTRGGGAGAGGGNNRMRMGEGQVVWASFTGSVREWWSQNVNGQEDHRSGERRRLLEDH